VSNKITSEQWLRGQIGHDGDDCLIWPFHKLPNGYGQFGTRRNGKVYMIYAHRFMCSLAHGCPPTREFEAAHRCGNRACVNPGHLSWKTRAENQADRKRHGTARYGRKFSRETWIEIRALKGKMTQREIAAKYGVSFQNVSYLHRHDPHGVRR
jgi:hypothetical protein